MAKILSFANQKGGTGKSTCTVLAANALSSEVKCIVFDVDRQRSITRRRLADMATSDSEPAYKVEAVTPAAALNEIREADRANDLIFVDLPGRLDTAQGQETARILALVDYLIMPITAGNFASESSLDFLVECLRIQQARSASARPLHIAAFVNLYDRRRPECRHLDGEIEALAMRTGITILPTRLKQYAAFAMTDTLTSYYDPGARDAARQNLTDFVNDVKSFLRL